MRRRAFDNRRPVRRRFTCWIWAFLMLFVIGGSILFVVQHNHHEEDHIEKPVLEINPRKELIIHESNRNFTDEILSATSYARQLSDQMTLAKAYVIIAKEHNNLHLAWELSSKIRTSQLLLSNAATRDEPISPNEAEPLIKILSGLIFKAQKAHYDIATTIMTMKNFIQSIEDRSNAATVQSTILGQLAAESLPKNLQCVEIKLTSDWLMNKSMMELAEDRREYSPRLVDNNLNHFCIFSDNTLAISAVINSTVSNTEHPTQLVFHVVTTGVKYGAMQAWFISNDFRGAVIDVQNIEHFTWLKQNLHNPSLLNHLRFYIPEIYPLLEKVIFLDDDVVVQKDLTPLFSLDLHGNVNGAVETCLESFHRYYKYLNFSSPLISMKIDPQACVWAFGMNIFDLVAWRKANVTARYHFWVEKNADNSLWKIGILPPGLLTFYGLTEPLDRRWHVLGLGYDLNIDKRLIETAAVIHFNGNMKPWLKMSIERYKPLWEHYVNQSHPHFKECLAS